MGLLGQVWGDQVMRVWALEPAAEANRTRSGWSPGRKSRLLRPDPARGQVRTLWSGGAGVRG